MASTSLGELRIPDRDEAIRPRWSGRPRHPLVFIMGLHRSGTTVLYQFLRRVLPVAGVTVQDVVFFPRLVHSHERDGGRADRDLLADYFESHGVEQRGLDDIRLSPETVEEYGWVLMREAGSFRFGSRTRSVFRDLTLKLTHLHPGASALLLKNPWDTSVAATIAAEIPDARFVFLRRDPVEILNSEIRNQMAFTSGPDPLVRLLTRGIPRVRLALSAARLLHRVVGPRRMERLLLRWVVKDIVNGLDGYRAALAAVPPERVIEVSYRQLVDDTRGTLERVAGFLDLPLAEAADALDARRRPGGLLEVVAAREGEIRDRLAREGAGWALEA